MTFFNNNTSQIAITAFMDFFAKISIEKYQTITTSAASGETGLQYYAQRKINPVPICYGTREKIVEIMRSSSARRNMNPGLNNAVEMQWILPRISVNLLGINYDPSRKLIKTQQIDNIRNSINSKTSAYSPAPYNLEIEVTTISRNIDENFQIMEQIIPFFSPGMSLNLKIQSNGEIESIPVILNTVNIDNPTDIPENDERIFTNTYSFTMKLNYYTTKKTKPIANNITINNVVNNGEIVRIDKTYIQTLNSVQDKFSQYLNNAGLAIPITLSTTQNITSTYSPVTYTASEEAELIDSIISLLGSPQVHLSQNVSGNLITLSTPEITGSNLQHIKIFYRLDSLDTIYEYSNPIPITFSEIHYWILISSKLDNTQLEVYSYTVI